MYINTSKLSGAICVEHDCKVLQHINRCMQAKQACSGENGPCSLSEQQVGMATQADPGSLTTIHMHIGKTTVATAQGTHLWFFYLGFVSSLCMLQHLSLKLLLAVVPPLAALPLLLQL